MSDPDNGSWFLRIMACLVAFVGAYLAAIPVLPFVSDAPTWFLLWTIPVGLLVVGIGLALFALGSPLTDEQIEEEVRERLATFNNPPMTRRRQIARRVVRER